MTTRVAIEEKTSFSRRSGRMNRVVAIVAVIVALTGWAGTAGAVIGTLDQVPAATLLLPYFEVDLGNPNGINTLLSINNASSAAVLVHVVVYSDLSVPTASFNLYLTGYDVQTISMRDIFNGVLPQTADLARDPGDTISHKGPFSGEATFGSCGGSPALLPPPPVPAGFTTHLANAHTGKASAALGNQCAGQNIGDNIARGYVVINQLNDCTLLFPNESGYFGALGTGKAGNANVLWGDYFHVDNAQNFAQGNPMVHIEASGTDLKTTTPGAYTFFGRYVSWTAADNREPLATTFATRFLNGGVFSGGTNLVTWRDSKVSQAAFACPATASVQPPWYPLGQEQIVIFDEQENPFVPSLPIGPPPPGGIAPFPAEANRTKVGAANFPVPFNFGWLYLNLNTPITGNPNPPADPTAAQAHVEVVLDASGRFSVGFNAIQLDSASSASHQQVGD
jgi:hypothetical protein